ncbi:sensor histidine kinase [Flaviaesturariibacter amylovorans]|uniref:Signal transduction histidine kinase internal region domain-containing protein n=1 Tax=Flaviaesturariibacter amylovorans TaxID=1084520 RepID=A0ABP8HTA7_9BACT
MPQSLFKPLRYRLLFFTLWWVVAQLQAMLLIRFGLSFKVAVLDSLITSTLLAGIIWMINCTLQFYIPHRNRYSYLIGLCVLLTLIWAGLTRGALTLALQHEPGYAAFASNAYWLRTAFGFLIIGTMILVCLLWYTLQDQAATEQRKSEAESLSREAELNSLRQQLQPHFLFNSLNSINTLIGMQPAQARLMVQQLSEFLRGTLKQDQRQWVPLEEELEHLQLYLDIEKVRFGHRLHTELHNEAGGMALPVMLLQPVVENAIKFGLYDTTEAITISIRAQQQDGALVLSVSNPYDPETSTPRKGTGFGLSSVQRRLYLLFARNDLLHTEADNRIFTTRISIPQP